MGHLGKKLLIILYRLTVPADSSVALGAVEEQRRILEQSIGFGELGHGGIAAVLRRELVGLGRVLAAGRAAWRGERRLLNQGAQDQHRDRKSRLFRCHLQVSIGAPIRIR
jgi:hypothetical protein